eukprot:2832611-Pleurochrysis_carterae.AAC.1
MEGAYDARRRRTSSMHRLVTSMIVHDYERILARSVDGLDERPGNVDVKQPPGIGGSVSVVGMRQSGG